MFFSTVSLCLESNLKIIKRFTILVLAKGFSISNLIIESLQNVWRTKEDIEQQLWNIANTLRGKMNADEFLDYILGFIFYKYLAEKMEIFTLFDPNIAIYWFSKSI